MDSIVHGLKLHEQLKMVENPFHAKVEQILLLGLCLYNGAISTWNMVIWEVAHGTEIVKLIVHKFMKSLGSSYWYVKWYVYLVLKVATATPW